MSSLNWRLNEMWNNQISYECEELKKYMSVYGTFFLLNERTKDKIPAANLLNKIKHHGSLLCLYIKREKENVLWTLTFQMKRVTHLNNYLDSRPVFGPQINNCGGHMIIKLNLFWMILIWSFRFRMTWYI